VKNATAKFLTSSSSTFSLFLFGYRCRVLGVWKTRQNLFKCMSWMNWLVNRWTGWRDLPQQWTYLRIHFFVIFVAKSQPSKMSKRGVFCFFIDFCAFFLLLLIFYSCCSLFLSTCTHFDSRIWWLELRTNMLAATL